MAEWYGDKTTAVDFGDLGLSDKAANEIANMVDASKALLVHRLSKEWGTTHELWIGDRDDEIPGTLIYRSDCGSWRAYEFPDGSVVYDDNLDGLKCAPDIETMLDETNFPLAPFGVDPDNFEFRELREVS